MTTKKQTVRLRERILADGTKSLYLDIWFNGKRSYEFLKLYIIKPKNSKDRDINKQTKQLAEDIRAKRQLEIQNNSYGFTSDFVKDTNFIEYFKSLIEKKKASIGNYGNWSSTLKHIDKFCGSQITFRDIDVKFVEDFKYYLENTAKTKSNKLLSKNSQVSYFNKFRASMNKAFEDRLISDNPAKRVKAIKAEETHREYLTLDELKDLVKKDCRYPVLKRAFLFSCLTGMRWSDINKMTWSEVRKHNDTYRIVFRQKKTKGQEYLDISNQALDYLEKRGLPDDRVFAGLKYSDWYNLELQRWMMKSGITKNITFHCARHTFAVLQLDMGTDIYTVSKLLGHADLKTTQVYAKIVDQKKREAVNKIPNINI